MWMLGYEPAAEGVLEDGLAKVFGALQLGPDVGFETLEDRELVVEDVCDSCLLS